jgi:phosphoglycerate kinase
MLPVMDDCDLARKTVLVRVDINAPLDPKTRAVMDTWRLQKIVPTLTELRDAQARQVLLAHQGRPGTWDFTHLERHAEILGELLRTDVAFVSDVHGEDARDHIRKMRDGDIALLNNVRLCEEEMAKKGPEEHAQSSMVKNLAPLAHAFVNDAFAAAHRSQCSLVGFIPVLPSCAGRLLETEVAMVGKLMRQAERPRVFIFGGGKWEGAVEVVRAVLDGDIADLVLAGGMPGNALLTAETVEPEGGGGLLRDLIERHRPKLVLPVDTVEEKDIGPETRELFREKISDAASVFISGPMGMFEDTHYADGTADILRAIAASTAFSMAGGGHTAAAINRLGLEEKFSYVSTGGGSLERMLMRKPLPVIEALEHYRR